MRQELLGFAALLALSACQPAQSAPAAAENAVNTPVAALRSEESGGLKQAVFAGGCFWGVEGVFSHMKGVTSAVSGYHGGNGDTAEYERVGGGDTGHAEAVLVTYDPTVVRYDQLLQVFFAVVTDPTQKDRQGPDVGSQYRNALAPMSDEQRRVAVAYLAQLRQAGLWKAPIVTRIEPLKRFYPAEAYHQDFMQRNPGHPYTSYWDEPKVAAFRAKFPALYKAEFTRR